MFWNALGKSIDGDFFSYTSWAILAVKVCLIAAVLTTAVNVVFCKGKVMLLFSSLKKKFGKLLRNGCQLDRVFSPVCEFSDTRSDGKLVQLYDTSY